jgi:hypothetical protein
VSLLVHVEELNKNRYFGDAASKDVAYICKVDIDTVLDIAAMKRELQHWPRTRAYIGKPVSFFECGSSASCPRKQEKNFFFLSNYFG